MGGGERRRAWDAASTCHIRLYVVLSHVTYCYIITHSHASHLQSHEEEDTGTKRALVCEVHLCQAPPAAAACSAERGVRGGEGLYLDRGLRFCLLGLECVCTLRGLQRRQRRWQGCKCEWGGMQGGAEGECC